MEQRHSLDMVNGPLLKNIFIFSIPLMLTTLLQILFNTADTIVVGKFAGSNALAAVGGTASFVWLLTSLCNGLSTGSNVVIANFIGSGDDEKVSLAVHTSMWLAFVSGILLTAVGLILGKPVLELISTPEDIIGLSQLYLNIYFGGVLFLVIYNFGAAIMRSKGDTKRPFYYLLIGGVLNVIFNLIFVIVLHWSVAGVAIATVISEAVSAVLVFIALLKEEDSTKLYLSKIKLDKAIAIDIIRIGLPAGVQGMFFSLSNVVIQSSINSFDSSVIVAANSAAMNIEEFVYIGMDGFSRAAITFTSQNMGAKNYKSIKKIMWTTMILDISAALLLGGLVYLFGESLLGLYTDNSAVIEIGMKRLFFVPLFIFLNAILDIYLCSIRGMGVSTLPTILMLVGIVGVRIGWLVVVFPMYHMVDVIYMCYPISWTITSIIEGGLWYYIYHKKIVPHLKNA